MTPRKKRTNEIVPAVVEAKGFHPEDLSRELLRMRELAEVLMDKIHALGDGETGDYYKMARALTLVNRAILDTEMIYVQVEHNNDPNIQMWMKAVRSGRFMLSGRHKRKGEG